ncbi:cathelicidin-B1-like [Cyrtonyx montezumae]|uniref:cathelicidin-B1-like n=1 Tax=Cyrtonyx montezumae TaxID=9017 RepID=UPI0032DAD129
MAIKGLPQHRCGGGGCGVTVGTMWPCGVLLLPLLLLGSSGAATAGLEGSVPPGSGGSVPPGLDGSVPPGLGGSVPPGLDGSVPPGSGGSVPPGSDVSITPKLDGPTPPKQNGSFPPLPPRPTSYLDAVMAAVLLLNQRIPAPCALRLRAAQPRPGWFRTPQRRRDVSFLVEDAPCPRGVDCGSCKLGTLQRCVGTVSTEQPPTAELRCAPLWVQPIRSWWGRVWEWWDGLRERLRRRVPFHVRGRLNIASTARP